MASRISKSKVVYKLLDKVLSSRVLGQLAEEEREELLDDVNVVRRMLAEQRAPRIVIFGHRRHSLAGLVKTILGEGVDGDLHVKEELGRRRWYDYEGKRGTLRLLDLRVEPGEELPTAALAREEADMVLFPWANDEPGMIEPLERVVRQIQGAWAKTPPIICALSQPQNGIFRPGRAERQLRRALVESTVPNESYSIVLRDEEDLLVERLVEESPMEVQVRLAHLTWTRAAKQKVAGSIVRAAAGITATIATVPLPVADIVPITTMQVLMVAAIAHLSGRELDLRTAGEFAVAMGANVGLGYALREVIRAFAQLIPAAGAALSATLASSATYAVGRAATAYFIGEERSI